MERHSIGPCGAIFRWLIRQIIQWLLILIGLKRSVGLTTGWFIGSKPHEQSTRYYTQFIFFSFNSWSRGARDLQDNAKPRVEKV